MPVSTTAISARSCARRGYVYYQGLRDALGPSFLDAATGRVTCGTPSNPIAGCTPLNIFNLADPQTIATLQQYAVTPFVSVSRLLRQTEFNASGELFELPAGRSQPRRGAQLPQGIPET
jgi:hypothetical protein